MEDFIKIAITPPDAGPDDIRRGISLLQSGEADVLHLRKPGAPAREIEELAALVPASLRKRVRLHSHFGLIGKLGLGGAHLNSRSPVAPEGCGGLSKSCHSVREVREAASAGIFDYVTLSPLFDSISKEGYIGNAELLKAPLLINNIRVIALGGVTPKAFPLLRQNGFAGAAMLGFFFPPK